MSGQHTETPNFKGFTTNPFDDDKLREECGVFGIFGRPESASFLTLGLHALQHRGQEAAGIVTYDGKRFNAERRMGHVGDQFSKEQVLQRLPGDRGIGHVRYSTTGETALRNVQPLFADLAVGGIAIAHNGNLTNAIALRHQLVKKGAIFQSTSDTETFLHLIAASNEATVVERLIDAMKQVEGAYSLVALSRNKMIGVRDPNGVRPLVLGRLDDAWVLASETVAFDIIGAKYVRDVEAGEVVVISHDGLESIKPFPNARQRFCIFEYVYFSRPDSYMAGESVYNVRKRIGEELARECPVDADVIVPVPDSGTPAAIGFSQASSIPFELGIIRNHYVGRTFIEPTDQIRHLGVRLKHNGNKAMLAGKRVVLVDDSLVRGTTSMKIVNMVREAGASEVHMRIACPPTTDSCFYGVDTPTKSKLLAAQMSQSEICDHIGADSLGYLTIDGLYRACGEAARNNEIPQFCDACFTGEYPIPLTDHEDGGDKQLSLLKESI